MLRKKFATLLTAGVLALSALIGVPLVTQASSPQTTVVHVAPASGYDQSQMTAITDEARVYHDVSNSVVAITVYGTQQAFANQNGSPFSDPFGQPLSPDAPPTAPDTVVPDIFPLGSGSGFVISDQGYVVTNAHVVEGSSRVEINFLDGTIVKAEVVGVDKAADIAVLKVSLPAEQLHALTFADSDALEIGQEVLAIGSPFGQRWTLTTGIVSALDRTISSLTQFSIGGVIQTDAAINPGNSGGPLLNLQGEVVGVNAQINTTSGSNSGIAFAIPANLVSSVAERLIADGKVDYSYLGIRGGDVDLSIINEFNLPNNFRGVVVGEATTGGPAATAGIANAGRSVLIEGLEVPSSVDIITAIDGTPVNNIADLISYLAVNTRPGDTVTLDVLRNGTEKLQLTVKLTPRPNA